MARASRIELGTSRADEKQTLQSKTYQRNRPHRNVRGKKAKQTWPAAAARNDSDSDRSITTVSTNNKVGAAPTASTDISTDTVKDNAKKTDNHHCSSSNKHTNSSKEASALALTPPPQVTTRT